MTTRYSELIRRRPLGSYTIEVGKQPSALAWDGFSLWVANQSDNTVQQVDPGTDTVLATIEVGKHPSALAWDGFSLWVTNQSDNTDTADKSPRRRLWPIPSRLVTHLLLWHGVATVYGWQTMFGDTVQQIDPTSSIVSHTNRCRQGQPRALAWGNDSLWVANIVC